MWQQIRDIFPRPLRLRLRPRRNRKRRRKAPQRKRVRAGPMRLLKENPHRRVSLNRNLEHIWVSGIRRPHRKALKVRQGPLRILVKAQAIRVKQRITGPAARRISGPPSLRRLAPDLKRPRWKPPHHLDRHQSRKLPARDRHPLLWYRPQRQHQVPWRPKILLRRLLRPT